MEPMDNLLSLRLLLSLTDLLGRMFHHVGMSAPLSDVFLTLSHAVEVSLLLTHRPNETTQAAPLEPPCSKALQGLLVFRNKVGFCTHKVNSPVILRRQFRGCYTLPVGTN